MKVATSSCITNILHCGVVFILYKYITSTFSLLDMSPIFAGGQWHLCCIIAAVAPPDVGITVLLVVVVDGVIMFYALSLEIASSQVFYFI